MDMTNLSLYEDTLKFYFVLCAGHEEWDRMHPMVYAADKLREKVTKDNIFNVTPDKIIAISDDFTKKHVVIFNDFKGDAFDHVRETHALILGPRSVISALMDNVALPAQIQSPMLNLAMRDLIICLSSFETQEKLKYRKLINYMGGICIDQLTATVTHLVTDSVRSKKYEQAILKNMKVMKSSWVHDVWDTNLKENITATNPQFDQHKVPTFFNLAVTTTGLSRKDKKLVEQLVESNGGTYRGEFSGSSINVVVAKKESEETPKLKAALAANKECLSVNWIVDSAKKGFALPLEDYRIDLQKKKMTSTPEKGSTSGYGFESSQMLDELSAIPFSGVHNDTASSNLSRISDCSVLNRRSTESVPDVDSTYKSAFERMNLANAKKAGLFLDGCNVFICGFSSEEKEKIVKFLNAGGATRYDTINSNLSHILVGNPSKKDIAMLQAVRHDAVLVTIEWLADSILAKTAIADCQKYIYRLNGKPNEIDDDEMRLVTAPSPASKRNILSMSGMLSKNANPKRLNFDENAPASGTPNKQTAAANLENQILDQYMNSDDIPAPLPIPSSTSNQFKVPKSVDQVPIPQCSTDSVSNIGTEESTMESQDVVPVRYLNKLKIYIHGFSDDSTETLIEDCEEAGAEVYLNQNFHGTVDYLIVPMDVMTLENISIKAKHIVNQNWLINAKRSSIISEIPYFYEPIYFDEDLKPLAGLIIAISIYASDERLYLVQMAEILGADVQETYVRANKPLLICPEPKSPKYEAAIRWNLSVVNRHWLMDCHKYQRRLPLKNYLVGDSIAPINDVSEDDDEILNSQQVDEQVNLRKKNNPSKSNDENIASNRRVDELRGTNRATLQTPLSGISSPGTDNEFMKDLDTPTRNSIKQMAKEYDDLTPQSKRRRCTELGIKTPEELTTPYIMEQRRQYFEELRMERQKEKEAIEREKESKTPWTEYKRRFWKNVLGDDYESPSQCYAGNTQDVSAINDSIRPTVSGRQLNYDEPEANTEVDKNIQKLQDFIKNRHPGERDYASNEPLPLTEPPESQMINSEPHEIIGWHDPKDNFAGHGNAKSQFKPTPCFSISCPQPDLEEKLTKQINALQGKVCANLLKYDPDCTHLLCDKIGSSEKTLSCISSGKWLLTFDYIEKSHTAGRFLDEELFEWGNPKAKNLPVLKPSDAQIANAAYRWRKKVQSSASDSRVFKNFRPILLTTKNDSLRTMVEAGGGSVIPIRDGIPLNKQPDALIDATHVICQPKSTKLTDEDYKALEEANVPAISMTFLKAVITEENAPDIDKFLFK